MRPITWAVALGASCLCVHVAACGGTSTRAAGERQAHAAGGESSERSNDSPRLESLVATAPPADLPACAPRVAAVGAAPAVAVHVVDGPARRAAQRGLGFLGEDTLAWQRQHECYGCHVQAVTFDAMIVGREHGYMVPSAHFDGVLHGLTTIRGGAKHPGVGFSVGGNPGHLEESSKTFGGAALAAYDQHVDGDLANELLETAAQILAYQNADGSVRSTDRRPPVVAGLMQSTHQAAATWRQAYARSADDRWLAPLARAEQYIRSRAVALTDAQATYLQDVSYATLGLLAAGADRGERVVRLLGDELRERQNDDGGWGFRPGEASDAFATGQAVHVLKRLGASDGDAVVERGTRWLVAHQEESGGWSTGGDRRGEAMWGVLGLVSIDVLDVALAGLDDGHRVEAPAALVARARDARGAPAASVELRVDDVPVARACAGEVRATLDPGTLQGGVHRVDVVARRTDGRESRRRYAFYTGDHFLTRAGTRFEDGQTLVSFRQLAPGDAGRVRLTVRPAAGGEPLRTVEEAAREGAMVLAWDGSDGTGEARGNGRFVAELAYVDNEGDVRQTLELPFVHDTAARQDARYGQVAGQLALESEEDAEVEGAVVELVDERGRVVQRTTSTRNGNYRFRNVDTGRYRVRVRRRSRGGVAEAEVEAAPASAASADLAL